MTHRLASRGEGKLGCIVALVLLAVTAMVAWKAVPVKMHTSDLHSFMLEQAKFAERTPAKKMKQRILTKARQLNLPVTAKNLTVTNDRKRVRIKCNYTIPLEFPGYTYNWEFNHEVDRAIFIF